MEEHRIRRERSHNLWNSAARKFPPLAKAGAMLPAPEVGEDQIGGLATAQDEVLTYACAMTNPEVYESWGTFPPSGLLLIGQAGCGKSLLARALATRAGTAFLEIAVPRLALEIVHQGGKVGELLEAWSQTLDEMPPVTVYLHELEFFQAEEIGGRRTDLPIGPIMDFLADFIDRAVEPSQRLVVGSTSHPDTLRPAFLAPGRLERVVEVTPVHPDDIVAALQIHARAAEKRAGRPLFDPIDWQDVVSRYRDPSTGDWIRILHAVLRRKARAECAAPAEAPQAGAPGAEAEAASEEPGRVDTADLLDEVERHRQTRKRMPRVAPAGTYV